MAESRVVIAEIMRPRGNRGELLVRSQSDVPNRLAQLSTGNVRLANGTDVQVKVANAWEFKGDWVLQFAGVDSIDAAERFRNAEIWVDRAERGALPEGELFESDFIGCSISDFESGHPLGIVTGWQRYGGPPLLEVEVNGRQALIPFVNQICREVNLELRIIRVQVPDGLLEL
jgi:16S rRNA processing protein RimM